MTAKGLGASHEVHVMILTPYKQQVQLLEEKFEPVLQNFKYSKDYLYLNIVDSSQGQERCVVIYSCVQASLSNTLGFVDDIKRLNVAITRAKIAFWVIKLCFCFIFF